MEAGSRVGPYNIVRCLGRGGMGEVYLAHDPRLDRNVALKLLVVQDTPEEEARRRFERETRAIARLDHPNIVAVHETGEHEGRPYLAMQYVDGPTLAGFVRGRRLTVATVLDLGVQICAGLGAAHEQGIVHRDIKPSNVLVDSRHRARLADFGLARVAGSPRLTRSGSVLGTIGYVSPEVVLGGEPDARSDIFSLGVVLYELVAGRLPFRDDSEAAYLHAVVHDPPEPLDRHRGDCPADLDAILQRALAKDRAARYATAADLGADLKGLLLSGAAAAPRTRQLPSIAVLPLSDLSPGRDQEYLCDGIAAELMSVLTRIEGLRVIARTSAFAFKGAVADAREIGRRLGVGYILEGSVRTAGERVRIDVQLIQARDGACLWSERYDRRPEDIFAVQDEVCLAVAERLRVTLLEEERARVVTRRAPDADAYTLYLKARFLFHQRREESVRKSLAYFREAIARDPRFALAHAGLAEACETLGTLRAVPIEEAYTEARRAALTAVELDERAPEAHVALGWVRMACDWDWPGAELAFRRALELNPAFADARHMLGHWNAVFGRFDRALGEMRLALDVDPVAASLNSCLAEILFYARRYDETVRQCGVTLEIAPGFTGVFGWMGMAHILGGRPDAGLEALREGVRARPGDARLDALLGTACAMAGERDEAAARIDRLHSLAERKYVDPLYMAWVHVGLGHVEEAFDCLTLAYEEHSQWIPSMGVDPLLDPLRLDPRFAGLRARLRLPA
jgi:serine/threonine-protein kinase